MLRLISLGMNCEVSFQLEKADNPWYASLFSWAFIHDEWKFLDALNNIEDIFSNEKHFHLPSEDMFLDEKYNIAFHGRTPKQEFIGEDGAVINYDVYISALTELEQRIGHLKKKFLSDLVSEEKKIYFKKIDLDSFKNTQDALECCKEIKKWFNNNCKNYILIFVFSNSQIGENNSFNTLGDEMTNYVRMVDFWAPIEDTKNGADNLGWSKVITEFI